MFKSMTAFASKSREVESKGLKIEYSLDIKTLNSKYLDIQFRLPRTHTALEAKLQGWLKQSLGRGRVELSLNRRILEGITQQSLANITQLKNWYGTLATAKQALGLKEDIQLSHLLSNMDWLNEADEVLDFDEEEKNIQPLFGEVMAELLGGRQREGAMLHRVTKEHFDQLCDLYSKVKNQSQTSVDQYKARLRERIEAIGKEVQIDPNRLEQELVVWVARSDFQEEVDRLEHHLDSFGKLFEQEGPVGRKFDFLLQEIHRELNTLGSKAADAKLTHLIIEQKALVERIKEQAQNIE